MTDTPHPGPNPPTDPASAPSPNGPGAIAPDEIRSGIVAAPDDDLEEAVTSPAKVMRIGSMVKQLLEEVRSAPLDEASRERLAEIYDRSVNELAGALSPDLREELQSLALPFEEGEVPSESELRVAKAQLVGWLEGLFHGIQATLMAQQFAARQQLQEMRQLPGAPQAPGTPSPAGDRPGTYL